MREYLVYMENVTVRFGKVVALRDVNFSVKKNEVVGLLGDNGAGKSTLIKALNGYHQVDGGEIYFNGERTNFQSPRDARDVGIETAYQDLALVNLMSISRNFFLGRELVMGNRFFKFLDKRKMDEVAAHSLAEVGLRNIREMHETVNFLSGGERQAIAIGRASYFGAKLLILDEPTAALSVAETEWVLRLVSEAKEKGLSVIIITHNAYEAYEVSDRFVVLQHGKNYADLKREETNAKELIEVIAGRK
ncbi:MAG: sugar ABC transporter ATP-binding protein [Spirochaetes bacterium]|nr:MAG: sugar ABC transporter ATP-binding protein [Spirochaetota bacterium]